MSADAPAEPGGDRPVPAADEQQTQVLPATGEQSAVPSPGAAWAKSKDRPTAQAAEAQAGEAQTGEAQPGEAQVGAAQASEAQAGGAQETEAQTVQAHAAETHATEAPTTDQATVFAAQSAVRDLPAGVDGGDLASAPPASARRGKLRRRLRYLRHVRELLLRDLGGFTYEVHRTAGGTPQDTHRRLSEAKAKRISAIDEEVGALEARLGEPHAETVLREAGIGGTCPECGELHASDARFCSRCGTALDPRARAQREAAKAASAAQPVTASHATTEPQPASVLWAGGPRPAAKPEEAAAESPGPATSEWLRSRDQPTTFDRAAQPDQAARVDEPAAAGADEPVAAAANEPSKVAEPAAATPTDEPAKLDESATPTDEPAKLDESAAPTPDEPATLDEPVTTTAGDEAAETTAVDEPAAATPADEPAETTAVDEPAAATPADEPAATTPKDEPAATTPADEAVAATPVDEPPPAAAKPKAKPKRRPRKAAPKPKPEKAAGDSATFEPGPNGRRDDDVPPPPVTSGDPLASRREQRP